MNPIDPAAWIDVDDLDDEDDAPIVHEWRADDDDSGMAAVVVLVASVSGAFGFVLGVLVGRVWW